MTTLLSTDALTRLRDTDQWIFDGDGNLVGVSNPRRTQRGNDLRIDQLVDYTINVRDSRYGARGDGATDDSAAFGAAVTKANALKASGVRAAIYIPAGNYKINSSFTHFASGNPGCVIGDGPHQSKIILSTGFSGDLFSWAEAWYSGDYNGNSAPTNSDKVGPTVRGIGVQGDRTSVNTQNAFMFYDRNDGVLMEDVAVYFLHGRAWSCGIKSATALAYMRESCFSNVLFWGCGSTSLPAMEIDCDGAGDSTNELSFYNVNIFDSAGKSLLIHNSGNTSKSVTNIRFFGLRLEKATNDLLTVGATTDSGKAVNNVEIHGFIGNDMPSGFQGIRFTGPDAVRAPYNILVEGSITSGAGGGVSVDAGRNLQISLRDIATTETNVTVASSTTVGRNINFSAYGNEKNLTYNIDSTSLSNFLIPSIKKAGDPSVVVGRITANLHDVSATGGNAVGLGAVDLQTNRTGATAVASGANSVIAGGVNNTASGAQSVVSGGQSNTTQGQFSSIAGGFHAADRGRYGAQGFASGFFAVNGDAQSFSGVLRATVSDTSTVRLTSDQSAAGSANCFNIPNNTAYALRVDVVALNSTNVGNNESWHGWSMLLTRAASAATTALSAASTPTPITNGTVAGSAIAATADTTNGGLNLSFTPPTANTDTWHIVARVQSVEVQ